jgi:hypothetical protein
MQLKLVSDTRPTPSLDIVGSDQSAGHAMTPAHCRRILSRLLKDVAKRSLKGAKMLREYLAEARRRLPRHELASVEAKIVNELLWILLPLQVLDSLGRARSTNAGKPGRRGAEVESSRSRMGYYENPGRQTDAATRAGRSDPLIGRRASCRSTAPHIHTHRSTSPAATKSPAI